jgi:tripartite-type tricarboxylate transporter receptor subunit TctC
MPVSGVSDLVAYLKGPGNHTFASGGFGTPAHLLGELFKLETGVQATHVPYVQFPQAITDLVSGTTTFGFLTVLPLVQLVNTGKIKALASEMVGTSRERAQARRSAQGLKPKVLPSWRKQAAVQTLPPGGEPA